jgi:uncharacterized protein (UPF0147 family)
MKNRRLRIILTALLMLGLIWIAWPESKLSDSSGDLSNSEPTKKDKRTDWRLFGSAEDDKSNRSKNRTSSLEASGLKRIDRLITHQTLSNEEVAEQLRGIAKDKHMPENVRAEALGHGVILDLDTFADLSADTQLPLEMAEELLQHVMNENRNPALQIRTYVNFLNHSSPEIRDEVQGLLAFMLEDDAGEKDVPSLLKMAEAKLKQLDAEKLAEK